MDTQIPPLLSLVAHNEHGVLLRNVLHAAVKATRERATVSPQAEKEVFVLLLISGASGVGKSTVRRTIQDALRPQVESVELYNLDMNPAVPDIAWRHRMAERAAVRARELELDGRHLLLAGDPVVPGEVLAAPSAADIDIAICLLDADETAQTARLRQRREPEELLYRHVAFTRWLREHASNPTHMTHVVTTDGWGEMQWSRWTTLDAADPRWQMTVIDTSSLTPDEAAQAALTWVHDALNGRAPVFRRGWYADSDVPSRS